MDAPENDFETADTLPQAESEKRVKTAKALARRNTTGAPQKAPESESVQEEDKPAEEAPIHDPVAHYALVAPIYRERRLVTLARKDKDVRWLMEENERLRKQIGQSKP